MSNLDYCRNSFLSDGVYHMICGLNEELIRTTQTEETLNDIKEGFNNIEGLEELPVLRNEDGSIDVVNTVKKVLPTCHAIHQQLMQLTVEQFDGKFGMDLEWTGYKGMIVECFKLTKAGDSVDAILSFLLVFSMLERFFGDIYLSKSDSKQCPTNLKELLLTNEVQQLVGENVSMITYVLAGPPHGVNLRNVLWHGFASPNEIPPQYCSFLLFTLTSISCKLSGVRIKRRAMVAFTKHDDLVAVFPTIEHSHCEVIYNMLSKSWFISPRMLPIWEKALYYYQEKRYGFVLVLLMPQLEHSLRRVFAWANQCPERVLTAESSALYTTFDEILAPSLPDGFDNQLRSKIDDKYLEMLLDILVHSDGPRVRDHISHGEVDLQLVPKGLCSHVISICIVLAVYFSDGVSSTSLCSNTSVNSNYRETVGASKHPDLDNNETNVNSLEKSSPDDVCSDIIEQIVQIANRYRSVYHPIEILKREVCSTCKSIKALSSVSFPDDLEIDKEATSLEIKEITLKILSNLRTVRSSPASDLMVLCTDEQLFTEGFKMLCEGIKLPTLFRPRRELEIVSLLCSIIQHCHLTAIQVRDSASHRYQQWMRKELRSRQRINYKRLLTFLPFYQSVLKLMLVLVLAELTLLHGNISKPNYVKFLKRCLQFSENFQSLSSPSKNRWDELKAIGDQLVQFVNKHLSITD